MMVGYLELVGQKLVWASQIFLITHNIQTSLLQDSEAMDSLPNHPKSCIGCIKWLGMFLKLWFGHYDGWIS
jgi:hypothetical protein